MNRRAEIGAHAAHGTAELAAVNLFGAPELDRFLAQIAFGRFGIKLRIARQNEILDGLVAALFLGHVAILALSAIEESALKPQASRRARRLLERGGLATHAIGSHPRLVALRIEFGGVVQTEEFAFLRPEFDPGIGDPAFLAAQINIIYLLVLAVGLP